jgi:hypothetical protein
MTDHIVDANKMVPFSPASQAVLNAYRDESWTPDEEDNGRYYKFSHRAGMAAALRAAADQGKAMEIPFSVVTDWEKVKGSCASFYAAAEWGYYQALRDQRAIADELEGQ